MHRKTDAFVPPIGLPLPIGSAVRVANYIPSLRDEAGFGRYASVIHSIDKAC